MTMREFSPAPRNDGGTTGSNKKKAPGSGRGSFFGSDELNDQGAKL
jgi:hypothetical protein